MVLGEGLVLIAAGTVIGLPASLAAGRVGASLLFGIQPGDPLTLALAAAVLLAAGLLAAVVPARHAASIEPMRALRQ
jgi:ABC-type antimicrobial peptide transport system permease subunit